MKSSSKLPLPLHNTNVQLDDRIDAVRAVRERTIPLSFDKPKAPSYTSRNELLHRPENKFNIQESIKSHQSSRINTPSTSSLVHDDGVSYLNEDSMEFQDPFVHQKSVFGEQSTITMHSIMNDSLTDIQGINQSATEDGAQTTSRSESTTFTEQISLFHRSDDRSVANYISQLVNQEMRTEDQENYDPPSSSVAQAMQLKTSSMPHTPHTPKQFKDTENALNFAIKCNNLSHWSISSTGVRVQSLNFRIIETIVYRESVLLRLKDNIHVLDKYYWKYAAERIKAQSSSALNLNSEILVIRRNQIYNMQNELAVGIAHLRSLSITIIEYIQKLRILIDKEIKTTASISVYWKGENYLLRLLHDCDFLFDSIPIRYWIGFVPNGLMIPPVDHNPKQQWKKVASLLLSSFLQSYKEKFMKPQNKPHSRGRKSAVHDRKLISDNLGLNSKPSSPSSANLNHVEAAPNLSTIMLTGAHHNIHLEEWQQIKDYCANSWETVILRPESWPHSYINKCSDADEELDYSCIRCPIQHLEASPTFWMNPEHNPYILEAAVGFPELFPKIFIVPQLPNQLLSTSLRLREVLIREKEEMLHVAKMKEEASRKKDEYHARLSSSSSGINQIIASAENFEERVLEHHKLKLRQQGDSSVLSGIDVTHLKSTKQLSVKSKGTSSTDSLTLQDSITFDLANDKIFALTNANSLDRPNSLDEGSSLADSASAYGSITSHFSKNFVSVEDYPSFRLENSDCPTRRRIENKIDEDRKFVDTKAGKLREDKRGRREVSRLDDKWSNKHARNIQRMYRGHLARKFYHSLLRKAAWRKVIVRVQAVSRGFIARLKEKRKERAYKIETFLLRKSALKRFRAAVTITQFIRKVVNLRRLTRNEPLLFDRLDMRGRPVSQLETIINLSRNLEPEQIEQLGVGNPYQQLLANDDILAESNSPKPFGISRAASVIQSKLELYALDNQSVGMSTTVDSSTVYTFNVDDDTATKSTEGNEEDFDPFFQEESNVDATQMQLSQLSMDEVEKQRFERMQAIDLIKRVNEGKYHHDTTRTSRLIPTMEIKTPTMKITMKKFSQKTFSFMQDPGYVPTSTLKSTMDAFVSPMPKHVKEKRSSSASHGGDNMSVSSSASSLQSIGSALKKAQHAASTGKLVLPPVLTQQSDRSIASRSRQSWGEHLSKKEMKRQEKEQREQEKFRNALKSLIS